MSLLFPAGPPAGIGGGSFSVDAATPAVSSPSATVEGSDVLAVYTAWWKALQSAYARADPADPGLDDYAVEPILSRQRASIRALRAQGVVQRTAFTLRPRLRYQTDRYAEVDGVCGFAVRLSTSWKTDGRRFCSGPGRPYRSGRDDPRAASGCSYTYRTTGTYGITGCKNWLVVLWRLPWYIPIVFPLELCNTDQVGVQETQVVAAGRPR